MHLHKWTKWQNATATYSAPILPKLGTWKGAVQVRTCEKCGKKKIRSV
jgi:hypothetical protein